MSAILEKNLWLANWPPLVLEVMGSTPVAGKEPFRGSNMLSCSVRLFIIVERGCSNMYMYRKEIKMNLTWKVSSMGHPDDFITEARLL